MQQVGSISSIEVTNGGTGYTSAPTVAITGGGGSGATATAIVDSGSVIGVNITNPAPATPAHRLSRSPAALAPAPLRLPSARPSPSWCCRTPALGTPSRPT
ncbi:hypothetical protein NMB32_14655 [Stenotrophomonas sp. CD2]|nr:hypothetical protein NMB32_14655 [Stenotrophomonas sp. CD2]